MISKKALLLFWRKENRGFNSVNPLITMLPSVFTQKERNTITLIILIILGCILIYAVRGIIGALLSTLVMYTIFRPINIYLTERRRWRRPLAAVFIIVVSFFMIVLPFLGVGSMLVNKAIELQKNPE